VTAPSSPDTPADGPATGPSTGPSAGPASSGAETRERLLVAATRAFAEHGVANASLLDITRQAGQRNRGAVHYHFGSREGLLAAVLEQHADFLAEREHRLHQAALERPADDLPAALEALVRPATELSETGWSGRCYLVVVADLIADEQHDKDADVRAALERTGGVPVYELISARMPEMPEEVRAERLALLTSFVLRAIGDRARAEERGSTQRLGLDTETFVRNLVFMATGMLRADLPRT
jgi:AcrR family transcriptional regulator